MIILREKMYAAKQKIEAARAAMRAAGKSEAEIAKAIEKIQKQRNKLAKAWKSGRAEIHDLQTAFPRRAAKADLYGQAERAMGVDKRYAARNLHNTTGLSINQAKSLVNQ